MISPSDVPAPPPPPIAPSLTKIIVCALCPTPDFIFQSITDLHRHATQMHAGATPAHREEERDLTSLMCSVCRKPWSSIRKLSGHVSRMHNRKPDAPAAPSPPESADVPVKLEPNLESRVRKPSVLGRILAGNLPAKLVPAETGSAATPKAPPKRPIAKIFEGTREVGGSEQKKRLRLDEMAPFYTDNVEASVALAEMTQTDAGEWGFLKNNGIVNVGMLRTLPKSFVSALAKRFLGSNQYKIGALCSLAEVELEL